MFGRSLAKKRNAKSLAAPLVVLLALLVLCTVCFAEEGDTSLSVGENDVGVSTPLVPPKGEASIVEHTTTADSSNHVGELGTEKELTFENDIPSTTTTKIYYNGKDPEQEDPDSSTTTLTSTGEPAAVTANTPKLPETTTTAQSGTTTIVTTTTTSQNAVQKAIEKALESAAANSTSITIRVAAGSYEGDLTINAPTKGTTLSENFKLYILADDSYAAPAENKLIDKSTIGSESAGEVKLNGNINIDSIDVVLGGLYLSLDKSIRLKNASLNVNGTILDDTINVTAEGDETDVSITAGKGNDTISLAGAGGAAQDTTQTENTVLKTPGSAVISGGAGDDTVTVDSSSAQNIDKVSIDTGEGIDRLHLTGKLNKGGASHALVSGTSVDILLEDATKYKITFTTLAGVEDYTDSLTNKNEISLSENDFTLMGGTNYTVAIDQGFSNYLLDAGFMKDKDI